MKSREQIEQGRDMLLTRIENMKNASLTEMLLTHISIQNEFILDALLDIREILIKTNNIQVE